MNTPHPVSFESLRQGTAASDMLEIQQFLRGEASLARRIAIATLLVLDAGAIVLLIALWSTEPTLPMRTHLAFAGLLVLALAWLGFFAWSLVSRRPLFAHDRVIAGRLAIVGTSAFLAWGIALAALRGEWGGLALVAAVGGAFVVVAGVVFAQAQKSRAALLSRRDAILAQLAR